MKWNDLSDKCKMCLKLKCHTSRQSNDFEYSCGNLFFEKKTGDCGEFDPDMEAIQTGQIKQWGAYCED